MKAQSSIIIQDKVGILSTGQNATFHVTQNILSKSVDYQTMQARFEELKGKMAAKSADIREAEQEGMPLKFIQRFQAELYELSRERNELERQMLDYQADVQRLAALFDTIEIPEGMLSAAKAFFLEGKIKEADAVLDAEAMSQTGERLLAKKTRQELDLKETLKGLRAMADAFLIKAQTTRLNWSLPNRYVLCAEYFETSIRFNENLNNTFEYAVFLQKQHQFKKVAFYYEKAATFAESIDQKATILNNLGVFYSANQKMPEAEQADQEALAHYRALAAQNPDAFLPYVATTLNNLGAFYHGIHKMPEAEQACQEALALRRALAAQNRDAFLPNLAMTLNNLGVFYSDHQKMREAEQAYQEALAHYRDLAAQNPDAFLPDLATTLNNLGVFYSDHQKMPEAEQAYQEALALRRALAAQNPDAFLPDLATTLNNLGVFYSDHQKMPEAEQAYQEALAHYRALAAQNPDAFLPDLATTLNNLGVFYSANQKMPEAEQAYQEALALRRALATQNPDAFLPDLASTLNNLGVFYSNHQKMREAEQAYQEALAHYRALAAQNPDAFLPNLAMTTVNLSLFYWDSKPDKAISLAFAEECIIAALPFVEYLPSVQQYTQRALQIVKEWGEDVDQFLETAIAKWQAAQQ